MAGNEQFLPLRNYYKQLVPDLTDKAWDICETYLSVRKLKKGDVLVREGEVCRNVSFINKGLFRMYYLIDGKEKIVFFCNELNYIADYRSFLLQEPSLTFIDVLEDAEIVETSYEGLQEIYARIPEANMLGRKIAEALFIDSVRGTQDANDKIEQRYNNIIEQHPGLLQRVPQYMIASYLGITPQALSRIKARMRTGQRVLSATY